jgi:hypothetical protein
LAVRADAPLSELRVDQHDSILTLALTGSVTAPLDLPTASGVIQGIAVEQESSATNVQVRLAGGVRFEVERDAESVRLFFFEGPSQGPGARRDIAGSLDTTGSRNGSAPPLGLAQEAGERPVAGPQEQPAPSSSHGASIQAGPFTPIGELYPLLFPHGVRSDAEQATWAREDSDDQGGLVLGPFNLIPSITATYVNATSAFRDTPEPTPVQYFEVAPGMRAEAPVLGSSLFTARYEARLRRGAGYEIIDQTTHLLGATFQAPLTAAAAFDAHYDFIRGGLESREVDPGGEFFFGLGRFTHHAVGGGLEIETGPRTHVDASAHYSAVDFDNPESTSFFNNEQIGLNAGLRYELGPSLDATLGYAYDRVPEPADRALAESRAHSAFLKLDGELGPLTNGTLRVSYRNQTNPRAVPEAQSFTGVTFRGSIQREFSVASSLALSAARETLTSGFELNPYYLSHLLEAHARLPLPLELGLSAAVLWQWNNYPVNTIDTGEPRQDRLFGWSIGVARPLTRWAFLRADYRKDRRRSNVNAFDIDTRAFTIQLGLGEPGGTR